MSIENFSEANGGLYFDYDSIDVMGGALALDRYYLNNFRKNPTINNAEKLFSNSNSQNLASCDISNEIVGEWFNRCFFGSNVVIDSSVNLMAQGGVLIGDNSRIGKNVQILTVGHGKHPSQRHCNKCAPIIIEDNVIIEDNAIIINSASNDKPVVIHSGATIKKGALVVKNVAPGDNVKARKYEGLDGFNFAAYSDEIRAIPLNYSYNSLRSKFNSKTVILSPPLAVEGFENINIGSGGIINLNTKLSIKGKMKQGDGSLIAPFSEICVPESSTLEIGSNVWIGAAVKIYVPENTDLKIGDGSIVGSQSLITKDISSMTIVVGNNKVIREIEDVIEIGDDSWLSEPLSRKKEAEGDAMLQKLLTVLEQGGEIDELYHKTRTDILGIQPLIKHCLNSKQILSNNKVFSM